MASGGICTCDDCQGLQGCFVHRRSKKGDWRARLGCPDCGLWQRPCGCVALRVAKALTDKMVESKDKPGT
jgi:hypothetical protein